MKLAKYKLPTLALLFVLPVFLTACTLADLPVIGSYFESEPEPVTLTYWGLWEDPATMQSLIDQYQEMYPYVTINYDDRSVISLSDHKERVFQRIDSGDVDIVRVHNTWVKPLSGSLSAVPEAYFSVANFQNAFYPVVSDDVLVDGNLYGIPLYFDGLVLVYNKDHFEELGQSNPPTGWEELRSLALALTIKTGDLNDVFERAGIAMGTANNIPHFADIIGLLWAQADVQIPTDLDTKKAKDALSFYLNFAQEDGVWSNDMPDAKTAFATEKLSMLFLPTWGILDLLNANPSLNIGVAPVPQVRPSDPVTWGTYYIEVVPEASANKAEAWRFINFLAEPEQQMALYDKAASAPGRVFGPPYSLVSLSGELTSDPYVGAVIKTAPFAKSNIFADRAGNDEIVRYLLNVVNLVSSEEITEDQALSELKQVTSQ